MNVKGLLACFFLCVGLVGVMATDAFAVAGKIVSTPPGVSALSGGELTLELGEPVGGKTEIIVRLDAQGEFVTPPGVEKSNITRCRYKNDKGEETGWFRCGGYLAFEGGAALSTSSTAAHGPSLLHRLLDSELVIQGGYSITNGINSRSQGAFSGGATFLEGEGANTISAPSYNFMLQHPFDRFRSMLGGGAPYVFLQGSKFHGLDADGGIGVSGTGMDRTFLNREISAAFGGGVGFSYPFYCYDGIRGGDKCFEIGAFVGGKGVRQRVSATADEAGNLRSFQDCYTDVVPFGGLTAAAPIFKGVKLVFTYEIIALYSRELRGTSFFSNAYDYRSDGGTIHNLWGGVSINPGKLLF
jgi:hypothetical protein